MAHATITSRQNPRVLAAAALRERAGRDAQGRFLVEGRRELERALAARPAALEEIFICPKYFRDGATALPGAGKISTAELAPAAFDKLSLREGPDGWLGVARAWPCELADLALPREPLLLLVERVEKPGNLGALLRTADAAGAHAVLVCDPVTDVFNPQVVRNSQGALFSVPLARATPADALRFLRARKIRLAAATPAAGRDFWDADLRGAAALAVGGEKDGLTDFWLQMADTKLRIPMAGQADSLNVSVAAALVLFEAVRQRRGGR